MIILRSGPCPVACLPLPLAHIFEKERKFFELPELEKLQYCERHRMLGNYLYSEGMLPKAAEQYQMVRSVSPYLCLSDSLHQRRYHIMNIASLSQTWRKRNWIICVTRVCATFHCVS
jgi:isopenicillin N synthase-like dioxygenase